MKSSRCGIGLSAVVLAVFCARVCAAAPPATADKSVFTTPLVAADLDATAFAAWVDGNEKPVTLEDGAWPGWVLWTRDSQPRWDGVTFGGSRTPGVRHLRIGWKAPLAVGAVLVRGGGQLGVLKAGAAYPGRLGNDADWLPAQRLKRGRAATDEVGREEYAVWVLPPGTTTRALRFTHTAEPTDAICAGWLGGAMVLSARLADVAPLAVASAGNNAANAAKLNNEINDGFNAWDNAPQPDAPVVSAEHPAWVLLTWPLPVKLRGLNALWAGFGAAEAQAYVGPADRHPRDATEADWKSVGRFDNVESQYPRALGVNWMDFGQTVSTRAVRLRITKATDESRHPHLQGKSLDGRRVWLGELLALLPLGEATLDSAGIAAPAANNPHPPIPVRFTLPEAGFVTLVIDDAQGKRMRNLLAETRFPAGKNTVWWDGTDDWLRDPQAYRHGVYYIPSEFVPPGDYRVRGLWRGAIDLRYEFSVYNAGTPAWETADATGAWLANHTPPCAALSVPAGRAPGGKPLVFLGSYISEGGHGLAWVDLDGRKQGGVGWVGGNWTGAPYLARDDGPAADATAYAYAAAAWHDDRENNNDAKSGEIRLTALTRDGHKPVLKYNFQPAAGAKPQNVDWAKHIGGLAARDGVLVASLPALNRLLFVDAKAKKVLGDAGVTDPRGLAFDGKGRLLVLSGKSLLRFKPGPAPLPLPAPETVALQAAMLEDPRQLTLDSAGNIYISDRGRSHQVKVFSTAGTFLRTIGKPGAPQAGPYDPQHMNNPDGLTVDPLNRLWVAENDFQPKRVSVWTLEGRLLRAFYGPAEYGGGGKLDPEDKTRFYYHGMEFRLDWEKGANRLASILYRPAPGDVSAAEGYGSIGTPEQPHYVQGRRYFSNDHNVNPTTGTRVAMLWRDVDGIARPAAALGRAAEWELLKSDAFKPCWPKDANLGGDRGHDEALFAWSDLNGDGRVQMHEVQMVKADVGTITVAPDLSFVASRIGASAMRYAPQRFTSQGAPVYDLAKGRILAAGVQGPASSGGDQALWHESGWTVLTTPPRPFSPYSVGAVFQGEPRWSYPSLWPGLHASHESPPPDRPGEIIGTTRLLGDFVTPRGGDSGPLWCINGNQGNLYLFTADGLFVAELFKDVRRGARWAMPGAQRGMLLNALTLSDENFWPSITQTKDGKVYLVDGARSSLVRVDGLETIRRLPESTVTLNADDLAKARAYFVQAEAERQKKQGNDTLKVALRKVPPAVDGRLDDWAKADWADIDKSGVAAFFDSHSKPYDVCGAVAVAGDRLYAAFRCGDANLLQNSGETPNALFKTGGALDLMIGADPDADHNRDKPAVGDARLLVTQVKGKTVAMLYRAVVPGTTQPVPFSSPWRTIKLDRVEDVSAQVELAGADGNYEISIPLAALGLKPKPGQRIKGDIGILRGNGFQTSQRVYWVNKASGITADVPSEAELTPKLWGWWKFQTAD